MAGNRNAGAISEVVGERQQWAVREGHAQIYRGDTANDGSEPVLVICREATNDRCEGAQATNEPLSFTHLLQNWVVSPWLRKQLAPLGPHDADTAVESVAGSECFNVSVFVIIAEV